MMPRLLGVAVAALTTACLGITERSNEPLDLAIVGGRVMDPESGLDAVRSVGIRDGRITAVTPDPLQAAATLDASGLVVAPGFIDLHAHGQDLLSNQYQARDGVTTALELETGAWPIERWYAARHGRALLNYGASVSHQLARQAVLARPARATGEGTFVLGETVRETLYRPARAGELRRLAALVERGLDDGGLGVGFGLSYTPGVDARELRELLLLAARRAVPVFIHLPAASDSSLAPFHDVVELAAATGAAVHVVHVNSTAGDAVEQAVDLLRQARTAGVDLTTEAYPYTAGASRIESPLFDGWGDASAERYASLQWVPTGERLTSESFARYRREGGWVIMHGRAEPPTEWVVSQPDVIISSDGIPFTEGRTHPRSAGTFARVLGHYVRERRALLLMEALRKMTVLPARRLEPLVPAMAGKGRIRVGADADLTLFDPARVTDRATFERPDRYSEGIVHVLVGGTFVVRDSALVSIPADRLPGRPIRATDER